MKASPTATIPATQPCLGPKVCCWSSSLTDLSPQLTPFPNLLISFSVFLFCFQALGEVEPRATLSSRSRYSPISNPTQSACLQDEINPGGVSNETSICTHICLCLSLQVVETLPTRPGTCQALTLDSRGSQESFMPLINLIFWKIRVFVYQCVLEWSWGSLSSRPNAGH